MTSAEANKLRAEWGDKPCDHPDIISDRDAKPEEDKWWCVQCGRVVGYDEWRRSHTLG